MPTSSNAALIRAKIAAGTLPTRISGKLYARNGSGRPCDGCDTPILPAQVEYEFRDGVDAPGVRLHLGCVGLWEASLRRLGINPRDSSEERE